MNKRAEATRDALGWLLLYLLAYPLPEPEAALGWRVVDKWAREFIDRRAGNPVGAT